MSTVQCATHGDRQETFLCSHLAAEGVGLGFHCDEITEDDAIPHAWCDDCELIRQEHGEWTDEAVQLSGLKLICAGCYNQARIRNTRTVVTLDDLADLRWKCGSCEKWHTGPALDFGYATPHYWTDKHSNSAKFANRLPFWGKRHAKTFLDEDYCATNDEFFYVRGVLELPIIGSAANFVWGVWGSLSRENFQKVLETTKDPKRVELPPMFSWLSSRIAEYPETLSLKMYMHQREPGLRPWFELEHTEHPLAQEYHHGIEPARVKEIMMGRLSS